MNGMERQDKAIQDFFDVAFPDTDYDEHKEQWWVMMEAFLIYLERQRRYGDDVWTASGWRGLLVDIRKKTERLWHEFWHGKAPPDADSALDLINYTVFFIRQVRNGDENGGWPW